MAFFCCEMCSKGCRLMDRCCASMCRNCDECCNECRCCPRDKPKPVYLTYALLFNLPLAVAGYVMGAKYYHNNLCAEPSYSFLPIFLLVQASCCVLHIVFAIYAYWRIAHPKPGQEDLSYWRRMGSFFWRDPCLYFYFFPWLFSIIWGFFGKAWLDQASAFNCRDITGAIVSNELLQMVQAMVVLTLVFEFGAIVVLMMSFCCECDNKHPPRRDRDRAADNRNRAPVGGTRAPPAKTKKAQREPSTYDEEAVDEDEYDHEYDTATPTGDYSPPPTKKQSKPKKKKHRIPIIGVKLPF